MLSLSKHGAGFFRIMLDRPAAIAIDNRNGATLVNQMGRVHGAPRRRREPYVGRVWLG